MRPHLRFYMSKNTGYNKPAVSVVPLTREQHAILLGCEPTKINPDYEQFTKQYIERTIAYNKTLSECALVVYKAAIESQEDIDFVEATEHFVRWIE